MKKVLLSISQLREDIMQRKSIERQVITLTKKEQQSILWDFALEFRVLVEARQSRSSQDWYELEEKCKRLENAVSNIIQLAGTYFEPEIIKALKKLSSFLGEFRSSCFIVAGKTQTFENSYYSAA